MPKNKALAAVLILMVIIPFSGKTQVVDFCDSDKAGSLTISADSVFYQLIDSTLQDYKATNKIQGYRIQIYFGSSRQEASKVKSRFLSKYPDLEAYTVYQSPSFKVRIGNFRSKLEAQKLYHRIDQQFKTVFIVPTRIEYPKLPQVN